MTTPRPGLSRLFSAAALLAVLGLPMTACAQDQAVAEAPATEQTQQAQATETTGPVVDTQAEQEEEKTAEELAAEAQAEELARLQREAQLRAAQLSAELAPLQSEKQRIEAEIALLQAQQSQAQAQARLQRDQQDFASQMDIAELTREVQQMQQHYQQLQVQNQITSLQFQAQSAELIANNTRLAAQATEIQHGLAVLQAERAAASVDQDEMQYPANPLADGTLTISDRRIPLNGAISSGTADYVTERIHYFNNLNDEAPIFIVIDSSPGGSVMEGFRIVTAMQNSEAPVHVVVKSYAASMAACITTLAEESYCYPNAIILHHQMSSTLRGNITQQQEWVEESLEWAGRLANPVADKMGVSYERFVELMYENNSDGDWAEFGDAAKELKWVNHVVVDIRERALVTAPASRRNGYSAVQQPTAPGQAAMPQPFTQYELFNSPISHETRTDGNGRTYIELPSLQPYDFYFLHDPTNQYRMAQ